MAEHFFQDAPIRCAVIHHQYREVSKVAHLPRNSPARRGLLKSKLGCEVEGASDSLPALQPNPSTHQLHQFGGDGQAQAGATVFPCGGAIGLDEGLENLPAFFVRHADARIAYGDVEHHVGFAEGLGLHSNHDFALLGEFDGVAHEVDDDPAQAVGIADQPFRHFGPDMAGQLQALLLGPQSQRLQCVSQRFSQVELDIIQIELARLDFGKVEDVVDQGEQ